MSWLDRLFTHTELSLAVTIVGLTAFLLAAFGMIWFMLTIQLA
jgi:hypothetical protein